MEPITGKLSNVNKIVHDLEKSTQRKMQKRENTMISFIMKATRINQDSSILINKLKRENTINLETIQLLTIENEIKEGLIREKEEELAASTIKIKKLEYLLHRLDQEKINDNYKSISTFENSTMASFEKPINLSSNYNHTVISINSTPNKNISEDTKLPDSEITLRRSHRIKKKALPMFMYNLRKKNNK